MIKSAIMALRRRIFLLFPIFFFLACGSRDTALVTDEGAESVEVLTLKLRARENDVRRLKHTLQTSPAHSRFKEEADLEGLEERLTAVRLKLDVLRTSDKAARSQRREELNAAYSDLTQFLRDVETRYAKEAQ